MSAEREAKGVVVDRRQLLRAAAWGGGILGVGGLSGLLVRRFGAAGAVRGATPKLAAEFSYDVTRFQTTDPSLRRAVELMRFSVGAEPVHQMVVDQQGVIYIGGEGGIRVYDEAGKLLKEIRLDRPVYGMVLRESGEILVGQAARVLVLGVDGEMIEEWSDFPDGMLPTGMALGDDHVFIADAGNRMVHRLDLEGNRLGAVGEEGGFKVPSPYFCVRMAADGLLRVANPGAHRIEAYTADGDLELAWGKASFAIEGFCGCCNPVSFDVFPDGSFVTAEKGLPRVKLYDPQGDFIGVVAGPEDFPKYLKLANSGSSKLKGIYVTVGPKGRILVLDAVAREVRVMQRKEAGDE